MTRMPLNKPLLCLLTFSVGWSLNAPALAVQVVPGGVTATATGDFVTLTAQPPDATLNVPSGVNLASSNGLSTGDSLTSNPTPGSGIVNFLGNSVVVGAMGVTGQTLNMISGGAGGTTVIFNGAIGSRFISFTNASTMIFNAGASGALRYGTFDGTAVLGPGAIYNGAATNTAPNTGGVTLNSGSQYNGALGDPTLFLNRISLDGDAGIAGAVAAQNIILGPNTLTQTGAVPFPASAQITVRALGDAAYGRINAPGSTINFTTGLQVNMLVDDAVILSGVPLQVVTGASGTFGPGSAPITTTSNNPRFSFVGLNPPGTGNVLILPTAVLSGPATPIPTVSDPALLLLAMLLGMVGFLAVRRGRP